VPTQPWERLRSCAVTILYPRTLLVVADNCRKPFSTNDSCPILASCARSQDRMSLRWPLIGRAQRRFFKALLSSPAHQYSLITINSAQYMKG
jgi:hypothetical protein